MNLPRRLSLLACCACLLSGCHGHVLSRAQQRAHQQAQLATERGELEQIPPPMKSKFMTIRSDGSWENPYITVQPDMLTLHVMFADSNPSAFGAGGMLRPTGARRQVINISMGKLADAMAAIPAESWPYGRVVGVEEPGKTPGKEEPDIRRNMETAISILNDLGIVAYDITGGTAR